jgi:lipopolysaccharide/colanic/teichoic acid biosynthesis glycosyltransferase
MGIRILGAQATTVAMAAILFFILPLSIAPKTILVLYLIVSVVGESAWRFYRMNREMREGNRVPALLIGSGPAVLELYDEVNGNDRYLIRFTAYKVPKEGISKVITSSTESGVRVVVIDMSDPIVARDFPHMYAGMVHKVTFLEFASLYEEIFDRVPLEHLDTVQMLELLPKHRSLYDGAKRLFDIVLAIIGSLFAIPLIGIAALLLSVNGGMPFIFNERIGKGGCIFRIVKLRSMLFNDQGDPELQKKNRVTSLGRLLRKTRIDELPQLWNVLVGDLSFIGPRPELPKIAEIYEREIPQYRTRHLIAPGLSGWAQIHDYDAPRGGADVVRTRRKLSFDLYYLKHRSFGLDLAIALKTLRALASISGT